MRGDTKGTPFLTEDWYVGYGIYENGETTRPQRLNYDIHGNNLVYKVGASETVNKLLDTNFKGFALKSEEKDYLFTRLDGSKFEKEKDQAKYYQIVEAPSKKVIIEFTKELEDPNAGGWTSSMNNTTTAEYEMNTSYYILNRNGKYEEVKLRKNSVLRTLGDKKEQIKAYISRNNLSLDTPEELLRIVEYYYSL
ncbi:hypothetical protein LPB144_12410 [Christiangramia salexigens]|uniref:Uncharacterized protein n=2 Tax=Christiangramia salexigens TaxID=1913577 RepID=A0A1L3J7T2_9FLAO|nr:hypothetical protein LPB144_12410 [Christiangramia salexigens]